MFLSLSSCAAASKSQLQFKDQEEELSPLWPWALFAIPSCFEQSRCADVDTVHNNSSCSHKHCTHTQRQGERYYWLLPLLNAHCVCLCYNRFVCLYRSCFVGTLWPLTCCFLLIPVTLSARSHHSPYDRKHPTSTNIYSLRRAEGTFPGTAASHMSDHCDRSIDFYCSLLGMLFSCTQDQLSTSPWLTSKLSIIVFLQFHITANYCERWMFVVLVFCSVSQLVSFFILSLTFSKMY